MIFEEDRGRIADLYGRVYALTAFVHALAQTYPAKEALDREFQKSALVSQAKIEGLLVLEETIEGFQDVVRDLSELLAEGM